MAGEWTDPKRRNFTTSFAQFGAPLGMVLANGALALMTVLVDDQAFLDWGWRLPFIASFVMVLIGLWIRVGIMESPVFANLKEKGKVAKAPVIDVLKHNWREVVLTALLRTGQQIPFYIFTTYILVYATQQLGLSRTSILNLVMIQSIVSLITIPLYGHLADLYGARKIIGIGCVVMIVFPFLYFGLIDTKASGLIALAIIVGLPLHDLQYAPQAAYISESFAGSVRYSGSGLGYQLASITAGGPAPIIAALLYQRYQTSTAIAVYVSVAAVISLISLSMLRVKTGSLDDR
jgi:MFS family permease